MRRLLIILPVAVLGGFLALVWSVAHTDMGTDPGMTDMRFRR